MIIGVPKEIKANEYRVSVVPSGVKALVENGHKVIVEESAGEGSGITDAEYIEAGATIEKSAAAVFGTADIIVKVKEPQPQEYNLLREGQVLFTYLHLSASLELTRAMLKHKIIGIAYETVQLADGTLPLLTPMSEVAGKLSVQIGTMCLQKPHGGRGVLMGGVPGTPRGDIVIIGGGVVGSNAAKTAVGLGANVTILDTNHNRLRYLDDIFADRITTIASNTGNIKTYITNADLIIGAVLIPGAKAPRLITKAMLANMRKRSVIVDVAIDQGGCCETARPTTHSDPSYIVDDVIHCCIANLPGAVARTSTFALSNATLPYALKLANLGCKEAMLGNLALRKGLNVFKGQLTNQAVADSLGLEYNPWMG